MVLIDGRPFLYYQLELLKKNKIENAVLCVGTLGKQIIDYFGNGRKFGLTIKYSIERSDGLLGTAGALKNAQKFLDDIFFVMYGDSYLPVNYRLTLKSFKKFGKSGLMTVYRNNNEFDRSNVAIKDNAVTMYNKSKKNRSLKYIDYGLLVLKKKILDIVPSNQFVDLDFLLNYLIKKEDLSAYEVKERFYEIGSIRGIKDFENYLKSK